jgi:hypothetical protein
MTNSRRKFKPEFKAKVAIEALKERESLADSPSASRLIQIRYLFGRESF